MLIFAGHEYEHDHLTKIYPEPTLIIDHIIFLVLFDNLEAKPSPKSSGKQ